MRGEEWRRGEGKGIKRDGNNNKRKIKKEGEVTREGRRRMELLERGYGDTGYTWVPFNTTLHYTTLNNTTLHCKRLHYATLCYTTLHYNPLRYTEP